MKNSFKNLQIHKGNPKGSENQSGRSKPDRLPNGRPDNTNFDFDSEDDPYDSQEGDS